MVWTLTDRSRGLATPLDAGSTVLFGTDDGCDVAVEGVGPGEICAQVYVDRWFAFVFRGSGTVVQFGQAEFNLGTSSYSLASQTLLAGWERVCPGDGLVADVVGREWFTAGLQMVQWEEASITRPFPEAPQERDLRVVRAATRVLGAAMFPPGADSWSQDSVRERFWAGVWSLWAQICRYGVLTGPLACREVTEVLVNGPHQVFLERSGRLSLSPLRFGTEGDLRTVTERMVSSQNRRLDESSPAVDTRLPDGSRVHAILPPLAIDGTCVTVRKFPVTRTTMDGLLARGALTEDMARLLDALVDLRKNLVVSGGTSSGKTTLLGVLSGRIHPDHRTITIEDSAELRLAGRHVVRLESRPPNVDGKGAVSVRELVRHSLRMRPDRLIIGECRGEEALDMLQALNTGHDGSMTTVHANSPKEALYRLETLALFAGIDVPLRALRAQVASAVHVVVQQRRLVSGERKVTGIAQVRGLGAAGEDYEVDVWLAYDEGARDWRWTPQGREVFQAVCSGSSPCF